MYLEKLRLDDRVALVIGCGGGGMGTQTSLALAEAGATVVGVDALRRPGPGHPGSSHRGRRPVRRLHRRRRGPGGRPGHRAARMG